ncbi:AAA family ATPase [Streptomyces sp. NPDC088354]|uniref:AAA family ATPase n=1 Tax=Streptomyces sp. NPDC088354 TaxID=3365856 RepID=UPI00381B5172
MIQQWYPVGAEVIVYLGEGRSTRGRIQAIGEDSIVLATAKGPALLKAAAVELIEAIDVSAEAVPPRQRAAPAKEWNTEAWATLEAEFEFAASELRLTEPSFALDRSVPLSYSVSKDVQAHLNRAKNRLTHAHRAAEPVKVIGAIRDLVHASEDCGYRPGLHLAALLLLRAQNTEATRRQAEAWMARATDCGSVYAWDLAVLLTSSGRFADSAVVLGEALRGFPAEATDDRLLRVLVDQTLRTGDAAAAVAAFASAAAAAPSVRRVALRAALYLLWRLFPDRAGPLEPLLQAQSAAPGELNRVLEALSGGSSPPIETLPSSMAVAPAVGGAERPLSSAAPPRTAAEPETGGSLPPSPAVSRSSDAQRQLEVAERQFRTGRFESALQIARRALTDHPSDQGLLNFVDMAERQIPAGPPRRQMLSRPTLPREHQPLGSLYAQAQYADTQEKDWDKAERLYREVLSKDPAHERARRSLAWGLHSQQRSDEALTLLRDPRAVVREALPHQNMIVTILSHRQQYAEAADALEKLLNSVHAKDRQTRTGLLKRLIWLYRRLRSAEQAKRAAKHLLDHGPRNEEFRSILAEVEKAERTGIWDKFDEVLALSDWQPEQPNALSSILQLHLERCEYLGVSARRIQNGTVGEQDVQELTKLIEQLGTARPADRAAYNLSAARILRDIGQTADNQFHKSLRAFGAAMGDLCTAERRHGDVTRTYYTEAVALGGWDDMGELKIKQFITSYLDPDWPQPESRPSVEKCMRWVLEDRSRHRALTMGLLTLLSVSSQRVQREIISRTYRDEAIRSALVRELRTLLEKDLSTPNSLDAYRELWQEALRRHLRGLDAQRSTLRQLLDRSESLGTLAEDQQLLDSVAAQVYTCPLDLDRITKTIAIIAELRGYLEQPSYLEQERLESRIRTMVGDLVDTIEQAPTRLSLEYLAPLLTKLDRALAVHFRDVQRAAEPTDLDVELVLSSYAPKTAGSTIQVQLSVTNPPRRSPAVDVRLLVLDNPDDYESVPGSIPVAHSLRDEQTETCTVPLVVTERATQEQVVTLRYRLEFTVRSDQRRQTEPRTLSLRLSDTEDWEPINNPFSEGAPVEDKQMFYGRGPLIEILLEVLGRTDTKCVVIYGQKRVGKSSVLHHLQQDLVPPVVAAKFSLLDIATDLNHATLLYRISNAFHRRLEDLEDVGYAPLEIDRPILRDFTESPSPHIHFDNYMREIQRRMRRSQEHREWRMVLLLDEFTVLYSAIQRGNLPREFMKSWKAMLESRMFSSVVVGNDLMPRFLKAFPNEFQVARQSPVSYLDEAPAVELITEPIAMPDGKSRYRGDSVQRVIELTARNPYYIQLFCNRLVQYMNAERQSLIGPADVDAVAATLVRGESALVQEQFDNLLTPGDADVSELRDDVVLAVLRLGLTGHRRDLYIDGPKVREHPEGKRVLDDLLRRDVIDRESENRYRIKVGLFAEWLWHRKE